MGNKFNYEKMYKEEKKDSLFYDSGFVVASFTNGDYVIKLEASGEKNFKLKKEDILLTKSKDFDNNFQNDSELKKAVENGDLEDIYNNWFEVIILKDGVEKETETIVSIEDFEAYNESDLKELVNWYNN